MWRSRGQFLDRQQQGGPVYRGLHGANELLFWGWYHSNSHYKPTTLGCDWTTSSEQLGEIRYKISHIHAFLRHVDFRVGVVILDHPVVGLARRVPGSARLVRCRLEADRGADQCPPAMPRQKATAWSHGRRSAAEYGTEGRGKWVSRGLTSHSTLYRSFRGRFLQARWPNQHRQSTEGSQLAAEIGFSPTRTTPLCYNMN